MTTPEKDNGEGEKGLVEKWWEKWIELFANLIGVQELEKTMASLAKEQDVTKVKDALAGLQTEDKEREKEDFVRSLTNLLLHKDEDGNQAEINKLLESKLYLKKDPDAKGIVDKFSNSLKDEKSEGAAYIESQTKVSDRKDNDLLRVKNKLQKVGVKEKEEVEQIRAEISEQFTQKQVLSGDEKDQVIKEFWQDVEEDLIVEKTAGKKKGVVEIKRIAIRRHELHEAQAIYARIQGGANGVELSEKEEALLANFLLKQLRDREDSVDLILNDFEKKLTTDSFIRLTNLMFRSEEGGNSGTPSSEGNSGEANENLTKTLEMLFGKRGKKNIAEFDENDWEQLRLSGMLNVNGERYAVLNGAIRKELEKRGSRLAGNPLIVDKQRKTATVNEKLTPEQKDFVNKYFRNILISEVRMMVDESVQISNSNVDARATEYVTLMSVMGLSTSMKSDVMNSARRMTFAFTVFNTPQTKEGYQQLGEYAAQIGPEYSVLDHVMKLRERITIKVEGGKEIELADLSQIDFVNVASQAIIDPEDRLHFGITKGVTEVGRTYADMIMASNLREKRLDDWVPLTRKVMQERLGSDGYREMLIRIEAVDDTGNPKFASDEDRVKGISLESKYLRAVGDKYWDYYNGIYTYYLMTRSSGEFVGNANPDNSKLKLPGGLNENFNFKMDPSAWAVFAQAYNTPNFPEVMQLARFNGNSSLASKEGGEVLSYLLQTSRDPVTKLPTIGDVFYEAGKVPSKDKLAKLRAVFVSSIFLPDQYKLAGKTAELAKKSHIYESIASKYDKEDKELKLDPTAQRRDFGTARKEMVRGLANLYKHDPTIFDDMNFEFLKKEFSHDEVLMKVLNSDTKTGFQKMLAFARRYGEDKLLFNNLSNKRPDDFTKYANDYHTEWQSALTALATKPTWATYIKMMAVVEKIVGKGEKSDPLVMRGFEYMVELRKARAVGQSYVRQIQNHGGLEYKDGGYVGELPGHFPVPDLEERKVSIGDKLENGYKDPSIVSMRGHKLEVDEEGTEQNVLTAMMAASLLTEETYKHERKHLAKSMLGWHKDRPFLNEVWDTVTGKKYIDYLAIEVFDMSPEFFLEWVIGGTGEFIELWWKYFNGQGGGGHH